MIPTPYQTGGPLLRVENLSVTLGGRTIIRDVNLRVNDLIQTGTTRGQVVAILGPSGIGKTTLFRAVAGLIKLNEPGSKTVGQVLLNDEGTPVRAGQVGVVAQYYPLLEHLTVRGNLLLAARTGMISRARAIEKLSLHRSVKRWWQIHQEATAVVDEYLEAFELTERAHAYPVANQLSGGQRQRAAIAQQMLCSEHFLLMDEPFSGLDTLMIDKVVELVMGVANANEQNVVIVVTHDISAAVRVADTLVLMGRDRDAEGNVVPGATVKATYNLIERGLAWQKDIVFTHEFGEFVAEIRKKFREL